MSTDATPAHRAELERGQLARLRTLLGALARDNRFWAPRLAAAGLGGDVASLGALQRLALTSKSELVADQAAHPPYGTNLTCPLARYTRMHQTSGTTATPLRWLDTDESWSHLCDNWQQVYQAAGVGPGDRVLAAFSFGPFLGFWAGWDAAARRGCLCIPGGGLTTRARLHALRDHAVNVLLATPTYAVHLGEAAGSLGFLPGDFRVEVIIVAGEPGAAIAATRRRIEAAWPGACVVDHHGMTEVGPASFECPRRPGVLHVIESSFLAEVIDPGTGVAVPDGEPGELVLTTLGRIASPVLRYRTRDHVRAERGAPCECGRAEVALVGGILGRFDDMVVVRGVNVFPSAIEAVVRGFDEVVEFRVRVREGAAGEGAAAALAEIEVDVEPAGGCADPAALAARVAAALRDALALRVPVTAVAAGALPRFEGKARRWLCEPANSLPPKGGG